MAIFILVHGTFARKAQWTNSDSPLCNRLRDAVGEHGQSAQFIPIEWSGKNLGRDRLETAKSIVSKIKSSQARNPGEILFLIGHSHGGSAIAYFLKNFPDFREAVAGCAFLSTPFIAQRIRPLWAELLTALASVAGMLIFVLTAVITAYLVAKAGWLDRKGILQATIAFAACFVTGASAAVWVWIKVGPSIRSSLHDSLVRRIAESETADIASAQHLFLRASGDEAAAVLGTDQFIAWSVGKLVGFSSAVVLHLRMALLKIYQWYAGRVVLTLASALFALWLNALFLISFALSSPFEQFVRDVFWKNWHMDETDFGFAGVIIEWFVAVLWPLFAFLFVGALVYSLILMLGLVTGTLTFRLFGWMNYREAIFTDFSVEPVPYGQVNFVHIDWKDQGVDASGLSHSRTYLNPHALECLAGWVSKRLEAAPPDGLDRGLGQGMEFTGRGHRAAK
jgi:hypothetical protein